MLTTELPCCPSYFLLAGDPTVPITYTVSRMRDGRSFSTRSVTASQRGRPIYSCVASFHTNEPNRFWHQCVVPVSKTIVPCRASASFAAAALFPHPGTPCRSPQIQRLFPAMKHAWQRCWQTHGCRNSKPLGCMCVNWCCLFMCPCVWSTVQCPVSC